MLADEVSVIAENLHEHGYATIGIQTNASLKQKSHFNQGFDKYIFYNPLTPGKKVVDTFINELQKRDRRPLFFYLHFMDTHQPYKSTKTHLKLFEKSYDGELSKEKFDKFIEVRNGTLTLDGADKNHIIALYDAAIRYLDDQVQRVFDALKKEGLFDDTIIIFTSDHGEEFWDHGSVEHGHTMYNELLRVPLLVWNLSESRRVSRVKQIIRLIDIFPTLMSRLDIPAPAHIAGQNISAAYDGGADPAEDRLNLTAFSEIVLYGQEKKAVQTDKYKLIMNMRTHQTELYDMEKDPEELVPLADKTLTKKYIAILDDFRVSGDAVFTHKPVTKKLDKETVKQLKSLGYL